MEEFIFGTLATEELKLVHHRAARRGIQHMHDLSPRDPLPGEAVTITVRIGPDVSADHVACYYTLDGSKPSGERGKASNGHVVMLERIKIEWDTLIWGYLALWRGVIPAQPEGTVVRYRIGAWADEGREIYADWPEVQMAMELAAGAFFQGEPVPIATPGDPYKGHTFTYHVDRLGPPDWAREALIYEIFVDRFCPGEERDWLQTDDLNAICGGTLWGVIEHLDYITDLGANALWLTPIFSSPTAHGYDATDLKHVESRLGGDEALRTLVETAHARGIRVILDFVCNHISNLHPVFIEAQNPASPYHDWFTFDDSPVGYRAFFNVPSMPQINVNNPDARNWLIDAARYWLREFNIDGYRLDYANGPGPDFWSDFWAACKAEKPDCFCFAEIVDTPDVQATYAGRLDGCLDFHTADALRRIFGRKRGTEADFERFTDRHRAYMPDNFLMVTFLDNHDMDRFLFVAEGDTEAVRRAAEAQMHLPGPAIIYYGTEIALQQLVSKDLGFGLEVNRVPMTWGQPHDADLLAYYKTLLRERQAR